jgi:hypothetical protein
VKYITSILNAIKDIAMNTGVWIRVLLMTMVVGFLVIYFTRVKQKPCENCQPFKEESTFYKGQVTQLLDALIGTRKVIQDLAASPTSYIIDQQNPMFMYAVYDSVPKRKKKLTQQQVKAGMALKRIDSIIVRLNQQIQARVKNL